MVYKKRRIWAALKKIILNLFFKNYSHTNFANNLCKTSEKNIFTYGTTRDAHYELIKSYIDSLKVKKNSVIFNNLAQRVFGLNVAIFCRCVQPYLVRNPLEINFFERLIVFSAVFESIVEIVEIEKVFGEINLPNAYLPFNSAWGSENLYTQFFKKNGCLTLSLQHAMYYEFIDTTPMDVINYINVESDYLLVWGAYSEEQIGKYLSDKVSILKVGNPLFSKNLDMRNVSKINPGVDAIFIPLPRILYKSQVESLFKILSITEKLVNSKFYVRLHPSWDDEQFLALIPVSMKGYVFIDKEGNLYSAINRNNFSLAISFNTSAVFEMITYSDRLLIFHSDSNEFLIPELNSFRNNIELNEKLSLLPFGEISEEYFFSNIDRCAVSKLLNC